MLSKIFMSTLVNFLICIASFIVVLSVVVFVHEFGHYIVAVWNGVKVDEFSIGYGREIFGWIDKKGTKWKVCLLPFGGFVKFFGDEEASSSLVNAEKLNKMAEEDKTKCLYFKNVYQRIAVVGAGPVFNYILAVVLFSIFFAFRGLVNFSNRVTFVAENSPAERVGIQVNDVILSIDGDKIKNFEDIQMKTALSLGEKMDIVVKRGDEIVNISVKPEIVEKDDGFGNTVNVPVLGIGSNEPKYIKIGVFGSVKEGFKQIHKINTMTVKALGQIITGRRGLDDMSGPVKIAKYSGEAMKNGFMSIIYFMALISISLGFMNLLPIPVLDGGHLLFYIIEAIRRKPLDEKIENFLTKIGFSILIVLMIFITFKDIMGIF